MSKISISFHIQSICSSLLSILINNKPTTFRYFNPRLTDDLQNVLPGDKVNFLHCETFEVEAGEDENLGHGSLGEQRWHAQEVLADVQLALLGEVAVDQHLPPPTHW